MLLMKDINLQILIVNNKKTSNFILNLFILLVMKITILFTDFLGYDVSYCWTRIKSYYKQNYKQNLGVPTYYLKDNLAFLNPIFNQERIVEIRRLQVQARDEQLMIQNQINQQERPQNA